MLVACTAACVTFPHQAQIAAAALLDRKAVCLELKGPTDHVRGDAHHLEKVWCVVCLSLA